MKYRYKSAEFFCAIFVVCLAAFIHFSSHANAAELPLYYTIQVGSYSQEQPAVRLYHSLADSLKPNQRDHLRVEKVGSYYTVRLGRFASQPGAESILHESGGPLAGALIVQAYIKPERISLMYSPDESGKTPAFTELPSPEDQEILETQEVPVQLAPVPPREEAVTAKAERRTAIVSPPGQTVTITSPALTVDNKYYTIQAGSYNQEPPAIRLYHSLLESLPRGQRDHLRVEKIGRYYTVRLGSFASESEAGSFLDASGVSLSGALILQAYIRPERISLIYSPVESDKAPVFTELPDTEEQVVPVQVAPATPSEEARPSTTVQPPEQIVTNAPPILTVNQPDGVDDTIAEHSTFSISYDLADSDDTITATFFYDTDNSGFDGTEILGSCKAAPEGTGLACTWDTSGVAPGTYYVYGIADDNVNPPVAVYSPAAIIINTPPSLTLNQPDGVNDIIAEHGSYRINYDLADPNDRVTVAFFYDIDDNGLDGTPISGSCESAPEGAGASCTWDTSGIAPGTYYIYGIADDKMAPQISRYSTGQITINVAPTLTVNQPEAEGNVILENSSVNINYDLSDQDDTVSVAFYYDTDNSGRDGTAISGSCGSAPEGTGVVCTWDTTSIIPGTYYIYGIADDNINPPVAGYSPGQLTINAAPSLTVNQPDGADDIIAENGTYAINYDLEGHDDPVTATFFYDADNTGLDGTEMAGACGSAPEGKGVACAWDTSGMPPGTYYIYGVADDGFNPPVGSYSPGKLIINAVPTLAVNQPGGEDNVIAENGSFDIQYDLADPDDTVGATFFYDTNNSGFDGTEILGSCKAAPEGAGASCTWDTSGVPPGKYYVYGIADDKINQPVSVYSTGQVFINTAPSLTVNQPDGEVHMIAENVSYTINYDLVDINDDRVSVAFFYDADNADFDGSAIKGNCTAAAAGIGLACTWDTRGVPPGTYYVYGIADDTFNPPVAVYSQGKITINATPSLTLHQPSSLGKHVTMGLPFTIRYDLVDPDDTITAAFYYDKDNSDVNGIPISGACETAAEGNNVTCLWDTSDVLPSTYYIYGLVSDGINPPVAAYSSGPVTIDTRYQKSRQPNGMEPVKVKKIFTTDIYGRNLVYPNEIHYDPFMDEIYLMSSGPNPATRITIYGSDYFPVAALGRGRGVTNPMGLTVDSEGNIYIAINIEFDDESGQTVDQRVMVLNAAFFKVRDILFNQENIPNWDSAFIPAHMALSNDETKLYISGANSNAALVIDTEGNFVRWLVPMRTKGGVETMGDNPQHPESLKVQDVVVDENGRIYLLCDEVGRIFVLDHNGQLLFAFGEQGGSTGKLSNPRALAVDVDREAIYVVDYMRHAINIYNYEDGEFIFEFGGQGRGSGWFAYPNHIDVDQRGNVLVVDMFNHRAQVMEVP